MAKGNASEDELIGTIIAGIEEVKGLEIHLLDLREIENTVCNYFVICTGTSNTHVSAIVNSIHKTVSKSLHEKPFHTEGESLAEWVLIDYVNIVVHVFQRAVREHYNIEGLWGDAKTTEIVMKH
ncbi:MAG: ribosome silencing factor [Flavobacteriaceae bacterium]